MRLHECFVGPEMSLCRFPLAWFTCAVVHYIQPNAPYST